MFLNAIILFIETCSMNKIILIVLTLFLMSPPLNAQDSLQFDEGSVFFVDTNVFPSYNYVVSDLDGDGDLDMIFDKGSYYQTRLTTLAFCVNDGEGEFTIEYALEFPASPVKFRSNLSVGNIDGDDDQDVVSICFDVTDSSYTLVSFVQTSPWFFELNEEIEIPRELYKIELVDFDLDGDLDLIAWESSGTELYIYENDGQGDFDFQQTKAFSNLRDIKFVDIDGDGDCDILAAGYGIHWYEHLDGSDEFVDHLILNLVDYSVSFVTDMNNDGYDDILIENSNDVVKCLYQDADHNFSLSSWEVRSPLDYIIPVIGMDVDHDGHQDVVVGSGIRGSIWYPVFESYLYWFKGTGEGVIDSSILANPQSYAFGINMSAHDLNGDGFSDLYASFDGIPLWFEHTESNPLGIAHGIVSGATLAYFGALTDVNRDDDQDIIFGFYVGNHFNNSFNSDDYGANEIMVCHNNGAGTFQYDWQNLPGTKSGDILGVRNEFLYDDLDMDGDQDIVVITEDDTSSVIQWYENNGNGEFDLLNRVGRVSYASHLKVVDFDMDGDPDIVSWRSDTTPLIGSGPYEPGLVWFKNESGIFDPPIYFADDMEESYFEIGDLDFDGDLDVMVDHWDGILFYINDGMQNYELFSSESIHVFNLYSDATRIIDINSDGLLDVVGNIRFGGDFYELVWYENRGIDSLWYEEELDVVSHSIIKYCVADLDGDNDLDIISANPDNSSVIFHENLNNLALNDGKELITGIEIPSLNSIASADLNGDSRMDILVGPSYRGEFYWFENLTETITATDTEIRGLNNFELSVSPNPASTSLSIAYHNENVRQFDLLFMDMSGRSVMTMSDVRMGKIEIPTSSISPGIYVIILNEHNTNRVLGSVKVVIQQ